MLNIYIYHCFVEFTQVRYIYLKIDNDTNIDKFLVAPPLPSGVTYLVTTASVCMYVCLYVCMYGCSLVEIFFTKGFFF